MIIFAITTSTKRASLSLFENGILLSEINVEVRKTHSTTILEQIDKLLEWGNKTINDIDKVIVSVGPGSFTGVRIAISVVKGLFWVKNIEYYTVNELTALTYQAGFCIDKLVKKDSIIISLIDAGKEKVYFQISEIKFIEEIDSKKELNFEINKEIEKVSNLTEVVDILKSSCYYENKNLYFIGDGSLKHSDKLKNEINFKYKNIIFFNNENIKIKSTIFEKMYVNKLLKKTDIYNLSPNYLEKTQAEKDRDKKN